MKAVFPCKGVAVLAKKDIKNLETFYKSTLATSKLREIYNTTEYMIQVGNFNYIPSKAKVVLNEENLLTLSELRSAMNNSSSEPSKKAESNLDNPLSDDDILSHPFFTTLKPID